MITTITGHKINRFRDLYEILPSELKKRVYNLKKIPQRPDFHPEGNTLKHVIVVVERAIRTGDPDIVATALFHDIGKDVTLEFNSDGRPTAHGHEVESAKLVKDSRKFIRELGGTPPVVYFLVKYHMRVKKLDDMRKKKQKFLMKNPNFNKLKTFSSIDRGGLYIDDQIPDKTGDSSMSIPGEVRKIAKEFARNGKKLYIVGGAVRDFLLGESPTDYDLATDAIPDDSLRIIRNMGYKTTDVGKSFGVVLAIPPSGEEYEIATFRTDNSGGRRPDSVTFTDIETDVQRRDLTINALFYDIDEERVVDLVGGIDDLKSGTIRTVGDPNERFEEDPLRKLRALRFFSRLGTTIDPDTLSALEDTRLNGVSSERMRDEFMKSLKSAKSVKQYLILADELGYLADILGGMKYLADFSDSRSVTVQLGILLLPESIKTVKTRLLDLKYTRLEINTVIFMLEMTRIVNNTDFSSIYQISRTYNRIMKDDVRIFASASGFSDFIDTLEKMDIKNVDIPELSKKYQKDALGDAIRREMESQFIKLYKK